MTRGPVLIDLDDSDIAKPEAAPVVPELTDPPQGQAMQQVAAIAVTRPSRLARWFWGTALTLIGFVVSLAAWGLRQYAFGPRAGPWHDRDRFNRALAAGAVDHFFARVGGLRAIAQA